MAEKTFDQQVYDIVARIPKGRVTTYGRIAAMIGHPQAGRFVGFAARNPKSWGLPWHRVVATNGRLVPGWENEQLKKLKAEGVQFTSDGKIELNKFLWRPK
jgi:methylated-DNA-protein-cysteine methyltransferase-like protein